MPATTTTTTTTTTSATTATITTGLAEAEVARRRDALLFEPTQEVEDLADALPKG